MNCLLFGGRYALLAPAGVPDIIVASTVQIDFDPMI